VDAEVRQLLGILDAAYDRRSWHGTTPRGSVRGLTARQAAWRPARGRHNIAELVVHAAYWKYAALRRMTGGKRGAFPLQGSNWFARNDAPNEQQWRNDVGLLDQMHRSLRGAVAELSARAVGHTPRGSKVSNVALLSGVAAHDLYHAGQIQLLKRLQK
jgi:uncharacterized damage-inducible protein DinB